jgi:hypothetical protein
VTATRLVPRFGQYANHAKKEANWGFPSRIWRISRLHLLAAAKTSPIWSGLGSAGSVTVKDAKQSLSRLRRAGREPQERGTRNKCAKQTQLPAEQKEGQRFGGKGVMVNRTVYRPRQNKANSGGWDAARPSPRPGALTMPPGTGASVRHRLDAPLRETKPNQGELGYLGDRTAAGRAQGKCAKQTQFGPSGQPGARVAGRARRGTTAPNKANLRGSKRKGKCLARKELWWIEHPIGIGKTNPIARSGAPRRCPAGLHGTGDEG